MTDTVRILVCDDDPTVRFGMSRSLRKAGYEVVEAEDGQTCLAKVHTERPEVALVDWILPDIDGPEVCRRIKADPSVSSTVVVLVSGLKTSDDDRAAGLEIGADGYLVHPLNPRPFLATIAALVRLRRAERELQRNQRLAALGTLAAGVGHEINNPLMGIINYAQLIYDRCGETDATTAEYAAEIMAEGSRVADIVKGLLGMTKGGSEDRAWCEPKDVINSAVLLIETSIREGGIDLETAVPDGLPAILGNPGQLRQVLLILLGNAREAFDLACKSIRICAETVDRPHAENGGAPSEAGVRMSVEDNGPGIQPNIQERIFEPFFSTRNRAEHSGLSLSVAREIVHAHGGTINVASEPGKWTRFSVDLPPATK